MVKISTRTRDTVTFSVTLPVGGMFADQIAALKKARDEQIKLHNPDGAQALHTIVVLAEGGYHAFTTSTVVPQLIIPNDGHGETPSRC
jgi:hypothetical protein